MTHTHARRLVLAWLVIHLCASAIASAQDLTGLYLTWTRDPSTTITINWVDLYPKNTNTVYYREKSAEQQQDWRSGEAKQLVIEPSSLQRRYVELDGLKPDTLYEFGIGKRVEKPTDGWTFRTMPAVLNRPIRFVSGGDMMHSRVMIDAMTSQVAKLDPDFALLGGDLAYENGVHATRIVDWLISWKQCAMTKDRRLIPMVVTIGNHEVRGNYDGKIPDDAPYFYRLFTLPGDRAYYALDFGSYLSLVILDTAHTNPIEGPQTQWLADALAARAKQTFLFACYHFPAYGTSKAPQGKLPIDIPRAVTIRENWVTLFDRFGVSAVFENDHHTYKRSHPLRGHQRDDENGIVYVGDGCWGVMPRPVPKLEDAWYLAKAAPRNHVWIVDLGTDHTATLRAMDPTGEVFDEFPLRAARTKPAPLENRAP
ncbi:MAG: fibronectin type III domain-containing protein [Tepidisphaeraceae bacterium]